MKILLTAFGRDYRARRLPANSENMFYGMPPVQLLHNSSVFAPDYSAFILADGAVMDAEFFERLVSDAHSSYREVAQFFERANKEGLIELVDYESTISECRELIDSMMERDLRSIEPWIPVLQESMDIWRQIATDDKGILHEVIAKVFSGTHSNMNMRQAIQNATTHFVTSKHQLLRVEGGHTHEPIEWPHESLRIEDALKYVTKRRRSSVRQSLHGILSSYLSYVNANIVLSVKYSASIYDWGDFTPFYKDKFLSAGQSANVSEQNTTQLRKLFTLFFPQYRAEPSLKFFTLLRDKRVISLRELCKSAAKGETDFDQEFATRTLSEVFDIEQTISSYTRKVSWLTLPLGFIPSVGTVVQKSIEESVGGVITRKKREPLDWFFVMNEFAKTSQ